MDSKKITIDDKDYAVPEIVAITIQELRDIITELEIQMEIDEEAWEREVDGLNEYHHREMYNATQNFNRVQEDNRRLQDRINYNY